VAPKRMQLRQGRSDTGVQNERGAARVLVRTTPIQVDLHVRDSIAAVVKL